MQMALHYSVNYTKEKKRLPVESQYMQEWKLLTDVNSIYNIHYFFIVLSVKTIPVTTLGTPLSSVRVLPLLPCPHPLPPPPLPTIPPSPHYYLVYTSSVLGSPHWLQRANLIVAISIYPLFLIKDGFTALHRAATNGHLEVVSVLIGASADVNIQSQVIYPSSWQTSNPWPCHRSQSFSCWSKTSSTIALCKLQTSNLYSYCFLGLSVGSLHWICKAPTCEECSHPRCISLRGGGGGALSK